jgi:hypothetical protein
MNSSLPCFWRFFHRWGRWQAYNYEGIRITPYILSDVFTETPDHEQEFHEVRQKRICEKCGFTQDVFVRSGSDPTLEEKK